MKKNNLTNVKFAGAEVLSRSELKKVLGGNSVMSISCNVICRCPNGYSTRYGHQGYAIGVSCDEEGAACVAVDNAYAQCLFNGGDNIARCSDVFPPPIEVCWPDDFR